MRCEMAKDDYHVIVYKILAYFYACLKAGKKPAREDYCSECEMFSIPESYWLQIMRELIERGYLYDMHIIKMPGGFGIKDGVTPLLQCRVLNF